MLLMLWTLDFLFVVVDYFIYLLEPIIARISDFFSFCRGRTRYSEKWPWLLDNCKHIDISLHGLSLELEQFYAMRTRHLRKISLTRSILAQTATECLKNQWPWLRVDHAYEDPSVKQLDWLGYDLSLIADWDCCRLSMAWDQIQVKNRDGKLELELVAQSSHCGKQVVQVGHESSHLITWQLNSLKDHQRNELRSALVFYYAQLHPELTRLHNILASLLGDLVEPSSGRLVKNAPFIAEQFDRSQPNYLSKYSLLLMIVANLQTKRDSKMNLAQHLVDFLFSYSRLSFMEDRIGPKTFILKNQVRLELVKEKKKDPDVEQRLEVLDPVELTLMQCSKPPSNLTELIARLQSSSSISSSLEKANVTRDFCREKELAERCCKLGEHLKAKLDLGRHNDDGETLLSSLLITSGDHNDYVKPRYNKLINQKAPLPDLKKVFSHLQRWFLPQRVIAKNGLSQQVTRQAEGGLMNFSLRNVLKNLLYLFIFLLIRDELSRQVYRWRTVLKEQAREDWTELKHQLFPQGYNQDEFDTSNFFKTNHQPEKGVHIDESYKGTPNVITNKKLPAVDPGESVEKQSSNNREAVHANETLEVINVTFNADRPDDDDGHIEAKELLAELMRAMMNEAMTEDELDLASLLDELGLDVSDLEIANDGVESTVLDSGSGDKD